MSDLTNKEKRVLERAFNMSSGYVLNFSNRTFDNFFTDTLSIDIYADKYNQGSGSKANRMRAFWDIEPNFIVSKALAEILDDWNKYAGYGTPKPGDDYLRIVERLKSSAPVPELDAIKPNSNQEGFDALAKAVREAIERNEPEAGLDRLHTFLVKYFRTLCEKHGIITIKDKPLHSLVGEYVKALNDKNLIDTDITTRILKSSISVMEAFNTIRNDHSFAHDNPVLNYHESLLIYGYMTATVRFVESIESMKACDSRKPDDDTPI